VALVTGKAFLSEFEPPLLNDPEVKRLAGLIRLIESPDLPFDSEPYITLRTQDGRTITGHVDYAGGAPQNPLPPAKIIEKFETLAQRVLPRPAIDELRDKVLAATNLADIREIAVCLRVAAQVQPSGDQQHATA
jgi:2-methylcitrate dehydratase PrpD